MVCWNIFHRASKNNCFKFPATVSEVWQQLFSVPSGTVTAASPNTLVKYAKIVQTWTHSELYANKGSSSGGNHYSHNTDYFHYQYYSHHLLSGL